MRQIILDTETTGLSPKQGHRIIEIACIEMENRQITGRHFHKHFNPEREIDVDAARIHGMTWEMLRDKPYFANLVDEFLEFITGTELIIHNAPFDLGFLNAELERLGRVPIETLCTHIDTLKLAKTQRPGKRNSLDALCEHFGINNSGRTLHGALLDSELLAEVYLAMTRGQNSLLIDTEDIKPSKNIAEKSTARDKLKVLLASNNEISQHEKILQSIDKESKSHCLWVKTP